MQDLHENHACDWSFLLKYYFNNNNNNIFQASRCGYTLRVTSHKHLIHLSTLHQHSKFHDY